MAPLLPCGLRPLGARGRKFALLGLFSISLAGCVGLHVAAPAAAFYLMPARLWEFLAGALVAERVIPPLRVPWLAEAGAGAALLGLAVAIGRFSAATAHPSLPTLLPCLATATLIHVGGTRMTLAGRLLGSRALVGIGLISYSVYLWHWPLLVFARSEGWLLSPAGQLVAGAALLSLSMLSWRFVELPFRKPGSPLQRQAAGVLLPAAAFLGAASVAVIAARGLPGRFDPAVAQVAGYYDYANRRQFREGTCFITSKYGDARSLDRETCLHMAADRLNVLLIGDSHAAHLWIGLKTVLTAANVMQATASGCKPLLAPAGKRYCTDLVDEIMYGFLPRQSVDVVLLSAAWDADDAANIAATVAYLRHYTRKVVVLGRIPGHQVALPTLLARAMLRHDDQLVVNQQMPYPFEVDRLFKRALPPAEYVSSTDALCPGGKCQVWAAPGVPLQFDGDHLTSEGSKVLANSLFRKP